MLQPLPEDAKALHGDAEAPPEDAEAPSGDTEAPPEDTKAHSEDAAAARALPGAAPKPGRGCHLVLEGRCV